MDATRVHEPYRMHLYSLIWLFALFFPMFANRLDEVGMLIINGGLIVMIGAVVVLISGFRVPLFRGEVIPVMIIAGGLLYYLLAVPGTIAFQGTQIAMRDVYELQRPVLHLLCLLLPLVLLRDRRDLRTVERLLVFSFVAMFLLAVVQVTRVTDGFSALYTKTANIENRRAAIPFVNPYDLAFVVTLPSYFFAVRTVLSGRWRDALLFVLSFLLIALTQSRSVFGGYAIGLMFFFPLLLLLGSVDGWTRFRIPPRLMRAAVVGVAAISLGVVAVLYLRENFNYLVTGFERMLTGRGLNSLNLRLAQLSRTGELAGADWSVALFGNGPAKSMARTLESTYVFYLFRYGVIGLILIKLVPIVTVLRELFGTRGVFRMRGEFAALLFGLILWYLAIPFMSAGNNFPEQVRVSFLFWGMMGVAIRARTILGATEEPLP